MRREPTIAERTEQMAHRILAHHAVGETCSECIGTCHAHRPDSSIGPKAHEQRDTCIGWVAVSEYFTSNKLDTPNAM